MMNIHNWHKEAKDQWDTFADNWAENSPDMWESGSRKTIIPFFTKHIPKGEEVCDLGCGDGYGSIKLAQEGYRVTGIDLSSEMIETAKKRGDEYSNLSFIQGDLTSTGFSNNRFGSVLAINSLEWTENPLNALNEIKRIVKPGGLGCFGILGPTAAPRRKHSYKRLYGEEIIINSMLPWEFEQLAHENGWEMVNDMGVEKRGAKLDGLGHLPRDLRQSVSFMWVFLLRKKGDELDGKV